MRGDRHGIDRALLERWERENGKLNVEDVNYDGAPLFHDVDHPFTAAKNHGLARPPVPSFMRSRYFSGRVPSLKCAVCQRPVRKVIVNHDRERAVFQYEFHCHDKVERFEVEESVIDNAIDSRLGLAFADEASRMLGSGD